jgi:hypothetical protein
VKTRINALHKAITVIIDRTASAWIGCKTLQKSIYKPFKVAWRLDCLPA